MKSRFAKTFAVLLVAAGNAHAAQSSAPAAGPAPGYPARPIRMIVPFPPGGSNDIMGRYFAHYLTARLGQQVVLNNRAGADGIITKLNMEIARYLKLPETLKRFETEVVDADYRTPEEVRKMLPLEMAKWAKVAKLANIRSQ